MNKLASLLGPGLKIFFTLACVNLGVVAHRPAVGNWVIAAHPACLHTLLHVWAAVPALCTLLICKALSALAKAMLGCAPARAARRRRRRWWRWVGATRGAAAAGLGTPGLHRLGLTSHSHIVPAILGVPRAPPLCVRATGWWWWWRWRWRRWRWRWATP